MKYEELIHENGEKVIVRTNDDGSLSTIPCNESNLDYQRYLRWLENPVAEEGGTL